MPAYDVYLRMREHGRLARALSSTSRTADIVTGHDFGGRYLSKPNQSPHIIWVPSGDEYGPPVLGDVRLGDPDFRYDEHRDQDDDLVEGIHSRREGVQVHLYERWYPQLDQLIRDFVVVLREVCIAVGNYALTGGSPIPYTQVREGTVGYRLGVRIASPIYNDYRTAPPQTVALTLPTLEPPAEEPEPADPDEARAWRYRQLRRWRRATLEERVEGDLPGEESLLRRGP